MHFCTCTAFMNPLFGRRMCISKCTYVLHSCLYYWMCKIYVLIRSLICVDVPAHTTLAHRCDARTPRHTGTTRDAPGGATSGGAVPACPKQPVPARTTPLRATTPSAVQRPLHPACAAPTTPATCSGACTCVCTQTPRCSSKHREARPAPPRCKRQAATTTKTAGLCNTAATTTTVPPHTRAMQAGPRTTQLARGGRPHHAATKWRWTKQREVQGQFFFGGTLLAKDDTVFH